MSEEHVIVTGASRGIGAAIREQIGFLTGETIYVDGGHGVNH